MSNGSIEYVKERANIQFKSLNFMRGRSFNGAYIIIDESQGLTQFQLKSIISRVGSDSKIVVLGNLAQIDNKYISPLTSGLTYLVERVKPYPHADHAHQWHREIETCGVRGGEPLNRPILRPGYRSR